MTEESAINRLTAIHDPAYTAPVGDDVGGLSGRLHRQRFRWSDRRVKVVSEQGTHLFNESEHGDEEEHGKEVSELHVGVGCQEYYEDITNPSFTFILVQARSRSAQYLQSGLRGDKHSMSQ